MDNQGENEGVERYFESFCRYDGEPINRVIEAT